MSVLRHTKQFYGKLHLGMPFGINLRAVVDDIDMLLSQLSATFVTFSYNQQKLHYFYHPYNVTNNNERIIEIPIIRTYTGSVLPSKLLEIGNVLSHYQPSTHTVVDKYETAPNVINQDVVDYKPNKKFDLIVSISTLEHVGQDEASKNPAKAIRAIKHLQSLLTPMGKCIISVPLGHNHDLDTYIHTYATKFPKRVSYYKRISENNRWTQTVRKDTINCMYNQPYPCANGLAFATFLSSRKKSTP